jgi:dolichyl-phosphate-mannose--protein O-mannosyl transferase
MDSYEIRYGDKIKLKHVNTGNVLHSHSINYVTGSHQQEVTAFEGRDDSDWWIVKYYHGNEDHHHHHVVENGSTIRLEHVATRKNLHSHLNFCSPSSRQGEIIAFGNKGQGDEWDNWRLEIEEHETGVKWQACHQFRLIHIKTNYALHSHASNFTNTYQQEVTGYGARDSGDIWQVESYS